MLVHILLIISLFTIINRAIANGVIGFFDYVIFFYWILIVFLAFSITIIIEGFIIRAFLRKYEFNSKKLYIFILKINLFTFTLTQILAPFFLTTYVPSWTLYQDFLIRYIFLYMIIEIIPILLECGFFIRFYFGLNKQMLFRPPIRIKTIILSTITANLVSAITGIMFSLLIIGYYFW